MKVITMCICGLFIMFSLGCYSVFDEASDTPYTCTVLSVSGDGNKVYRTGTFERRQLESIVKNGGGMLGVHVKMLTEVDGKYVSAILKQEESFGGAVVCKKISTD